MTISVPKEFDLQHIFECGQCFRWERLECPSEDSGNDRYDSRLAYRGTAFGRTVTMVQSGDQLEVFPCTQAEFDDIWYDYLDLGRDYGKIIDTLSSNDPMMKKATTFGYGIRILKQDLWETIVSFIISQNSNIPRIKGCIERLCAVAAGDDPDGVTSASRKGTVKDGDAPDGVTAAPRKGTVAAASQTAVPLRSFPAPGELARLTEADLAPVRLGYRQKYIMQVAREVCDRGLPQTEEELLALTGVGPKVAACISLFGLGNTASFPIDTWVKQVMNHLYGFDIDDMAGMKRYAEEHFGQLGGFAQQYLFYYMRETGGTK